MDIEEFSEKFGDKMAEMKAYLEGGDVRELMAGLAIEHTEENFRLEGYVDEVLNPWREVKRRDPLFALVRSLRTDGATLILRPCISNRKEGCQSISDEG